MDPNQSYVIAHMSSIQEHGPLIFKEAPVCYIAYVRICVMHSIRTSTFGIQEVVGFQVC